MDKKNEKLNVEVFDYSTIPKFMKDHGRFCLWKLVMKPGKTKPDKIPYRIDGKRADATNPQHYSSFDETVKAFGNGGYAELISRQAKKKRHNLHCRKLCRLFQRLKIPN